VNIPITVNAARYLLGSSL